MAKTPSQSFQRVLTEAVADLRQNGYDSKARMEKWTRALRKAAEKSVGTEEMMEYEIKRALRNTYTKQVTGGMIAKGQGIPSHKVTNLSPALRRQLNRRINAAADLIKLNRDQSIAKTLQRFSGWATSQEPGTVTPEKVREIKEEIAKPIRSQPFEKRRVIIDQTAKLNGSMNYLIANENQAIAVMWNANASRPNYNHRKEHLARDGKFFALQDSWAYQKGLINKGAGVYEDIDGFGVLPFCSCRGRWIYHLDQLPDGMLTAKGRDFIESKQGTQK